MKTLLFFLLCAAFGAGVALATGSQLLGVLGTLFAVGLITHVQSRKPKT